jgi:hypothetical protein
MAQAAQWDTEMGRVLIGLILITALAFLAYRIAVHGAHGFFGNW